MEVGATEGLVVGADVGVAVGVAVGATVGAAVKGRSICTNGSKDPLAGAEDVS